MASRPTATVPVYEYVDRSSPGTYFDDLEEALRTGPTMMEIDAEEAAAFQGVRHHFDHPKVPDPETLSDEPTPGPEWTQILLELGGDDPARRAAALQHVLTSGSALYVRVEEEPDDRRLEEGGRKPGTREAADHGCAARMGRHRRLAYARARMGARAVHARVAGVGAPPHRAVEMPGSGPPQDGRVRADRIELQPRSSNPEHQPIVIDGTTADWEIVGVVVGATIAARPTTGC